MKKALKKLITKLNGNIPEATGDLEIVGITDLADSSVVYRISVKVKPMQYAVVERKLRKEIKDAFDEAKISIPFPQIEVHNGK